MTAAIVRSRGRIVIPAQIRAALGVQAGSRVEFVKTEEGWLIKLASLSVSSLKGALKRPHQSVSAEDMNLAIRRRAKRLNSDY